MVASILLPFVCRADLIDMYRKAGLKPLHVSAQSGKVKYELSVACINDLQMMVQNKILLYESLKNKINWQLPYLFLHLWPVITGVLSLKLLVRICKP